MRIRARTLRTEVCVEAEEVETGRPLPIAGIVGLTATVLALVATMVCVLHAPPADTLKIMTVGGLLTLGIFFGSIRLLRPRDSGVDVGG